MQLKDSKTYTNLAKAYASETAAMTRYKFIEYGARMEGMNALSEIIDKVVYNEFNHARMLYTAIEQATDQMVKNIDIPVSLPFKERWDLIENLRLAADDEDAEIKAYASFAKTAKEEGFPDIANLFKMISSVEESHKKLFLDLHDQMKSQTIYKKSKPTVWRCAGCGYEAESKEAWGECPLCKAKQGFVIVKLSSEN